ncbi:MAG: alanine--glyoxylate aminotransferase family protein [Gammaproteobacteria bacterium]|nr:alanine--glyoxylate aminotransferase family protein [Gammaproteobacteria bacterium]
MKKLFTPGPVMMEAHILALGAQQPPYNRTEEFSQLTHEILQGLAYIFQTKGPVAILTGSGTAAMEASVLNFLDASDNVLIINGGTFGQRWCNLCDIHRVPFKEFLLDAGQNIDLEKLTHYLASEKFTAILINAHETSTGQLYDIESISQITKNFGLFTIVDAISTICADEFLMDKWGIDVSILSSQKALALTPGLSFVAMSTRAIARLETAPKTLYLNLQDYLTNQERGQLPYTPAVGILLQLHQRLLDIKTATLPEVILQHKKRAECFRHAIKDCPLKILPSRHSTVSCADSTLVQRCQCNRNRSNDARYS